MKNVQNLFDRMKSLSTLSMAFLLLSSQNTLAGTNVGTMTYSIPGAATDIPTLSGTMMILLSLLLFIVAFRVSKQKGSKVNKLFISLLGVFALSSSIGGFKTISDAHAGVVGGQQAITLTLNSATTGTVDIFGPTTQYFDNAFDVPVTILEINIREGFSCNNPLIGDDFISAARPIIPGSPTCTASAPGNVIPVDAQCQLSCFNNEMTVTDERLKNSIKPLLKLDNDIQIYSFKYNNDKSKTYVGAMAQDLLKDPRYKHSLN